LIELTRRRRPIRPNKATLRRFLRKPIPMPKNPRDLPCNSPKREVKGGKKFVVYNSIRSQLSGVYKTAKGLTFKYAA
jgi:hypothetical protein